MKSHNSKRASKEDWIRELATMITTIREDHPPIRDHMLEEAVFRVIRYEPSLSISLEHSKNV
jgi:hypothetical protein